MLKRLEAVTVGYKCHLPTVKDETLLPTVLRCYEMSSLRSSRGRWVGEGIQSSPPPPVQ